jgi:hypothetical protein
MPITYDHIDKNEVLANFRRSRGMEDNEAVTDAQATEAAIGTLISELEIAQTELLLEKEPDEAKAEQLRTNQPELTKRHSELKNLHKILKQHSEVDTDLACRNWLVNRLIQLETEHTCLVELRDHADEYKEDRAARTWDVQVVEAAWTVARDKLEDLGGPPQDGEQAQPNRATRRAAAKKSGGTKKASR